MADYNTAHMARTDGGALRAIASALRKSRYHRFVGRFYTLRRLASAVIGFLEPKSRPLIDVETDSRIYGWAEALHIRGTCEGPPLNAAAVAEIRSYAERTTCRLTTTGERFRITELRRGYTPQGEPAALAEVENPDSCDDVSRVLKDPALFATARRFLGYSPRHVVPRLFWSPLVDTSEDARRAAGQTIEYHYDIESYNSLYAYFYIVGGGARTGAHVVIEGSNRSKPLRMTVNRSFQPEERVIGYYGRSKVHVMSGRPGFCFLEDPACFHKVLPPLDGPRLCLQVRYS